MIHGVVNANLEATIQLRVISPKGLRQGDPTAIIEYGSTSATLDPAHHSTLSIDDLRPALTLPSPHRNARGSAQPMWPQAWCWQGGRSWILAGHVKRMNSARRSAISEGGTAAGLERHPGVGQRVRGVHRARQRLYAKGRCEGLAGGTLAARVRGLGWSFWQYFIMNEEMVTSDAPLIGMNGPKFLGPTIIHYGTDEQKKRHLPGIAKGETYGCRAIASRTPVPIWRPYRRGRLRMAMSG